MFSSLGLFSNIVCPFNDECVLPNCVFRHYQDASQRAWLNIPDTELVQAPPKRRRLSADTPRHRLSDVVTAQASTSQAFVGNLIAKPPTPISEVSDGELDSNEKYRSEETLGAGTRSLAAVQRPISPPPVRRAARPVPRLVINSNGAAAQKVEETLNPRMVRNDPAGHHTRTLYLKKLHEGMVRLNSEAATSNDPDTKALEMTAGQLISLALDEEERIATENPSVYANIIKLRMVTYKKMTLDQWKVARLEDRLKADAPPVASMNGQSSSTNAAQPVETGLSVGEELQVVRHFIADQQSLEQFGFVISPPTDNEITAARDGVRAAQGWEQCERCKARFQVFPDRREDGALTSGGKCTYHHGRLAFPNRDRADNFRDSREKTYSCCNQSVSSSIGCTIADSHVFKINDGKRLASILQYERTPENPSIGPDKAVSFDCEMGFTVNGMELIRLTATSWPVGEELLDVLVRPLGAILDLNSRYSGVRPEHFLEALPYGPPEAPTATESAGKPTDLGKKCPAGTRTIPHIVESPVVARSLLFNLLSPRTVLIGHAIENDLNTTRIIHPCIVDTVLLFPHPSGLPRRRALKNLAKQMLWRDIQMGGAQGHDSKEDATVTGELVRLKVGRKWREMQREGWTRGDGKLVAPVNAVKGASKGPKGRSEERGGKRSIDEAEEKLNYDKQTSL